MKEVYIEWREDQLKKDDLNHLSLNAQSSLQCQVCFFLLSL